MVKISDTETIPMNNKKAIEKVRLNITIWNVPLAFDGARLECIINDVALARKSNSIQLKVFRKCST